MEYIIIGKTYGIDLGTTYSAISVLGPTGAPEIITDNDLGNDTLASAIFFTEDGKINVGEDAKEAGVTDPKRLMQFFKRWMGRDKDPNRDLYNVDGREINPIELSGYVLKRIEKYAKDSGEDVHNVVITCPAYFDNVQRAATKEAGEAAGLNVLAVINEPTAAALNYCVNLYGEDKIILVYDLGGGTFDVTLLKVSQHDDKQYLSVIATDGDAFRGGVDWDKKLCELYLSKYEEQRGAPVPSEVADNVRGQVESLKKKLSNKEKAKHRVPYNGENVELEVTRQEFEDATAEYVNETVAWLDSVLRAGSMTDNDVDVVLMVGGSTKMPMIRNMLTARFGEKAFFGEPDKAVAKGAAIVADMLKKEADNEFMKDLIRQLSDGDIRLVRDHNGKVIIEKTETNDDNGPETQNTDTIEIPIDTSIGEAINKVINGEDPAEIVDTATTILADIAPRTFGIIASRGTGEIGADGKQIWEYLVDNIVLKGECIPCTYTRSYETPSDNTRAIRLPIVESISNNGIDIIMREKDGSFTFPDTLLEMISRRELVLDIPCSLPKGSEIVVEFSIDKVNNIYLKATEPISGTINDVNFKFSETSQEDLDKMHENISNVKFAALDD